MSVANPRFPRHGHQPQRLEYQPIILAIFPPRTAWDWKIGSGSASLVTPYIRNGCVPVVALYPPWMLTSALLNTIGVDQPSSWCGQFREPEKTSPRNHPLDLAKQTRDGLNTWRRLGGMLIASHQSHQDVKILYKLSHWSTQWLSASALVCIECLVAK